MAYPNMAGGTYVLRAYGDGGGVELPVLSLACRGGMDEPFTLTATIDNSSGDYGPTCDLFDCTTVDETYEPVRWFQLEVTGGQTGVTWLSPWLLQDDHQAVENSNDATVTVQFVDLSENLTVGDQMMDDVESTSSGLAMAHTVIAEILEAYGITAYDFSDYEDHSIAMLHRVGSPIDWIREIIERRMGWFYFEEDTFILKEGGNWDSSGGADLELTGHEHLTLSNYRRSTQGVYNQATCQRVDASAGVALQTAGQGRGEQEVTLDFPCQSATPQFWAPQAGLPPYNLKWYDADDNLIGTEATYTGTTPAVKFKFTLEPPLPDDGIFEVPYELYIRGQRENTNATITANYTATYTDTADQALNGKRPLRQIITAPTVLNQSDAEDYVERWVRESIMGYAKAEVETILDATVTPGITVSLTVKRQKLTAHAMRVANYAFNINLDGNSPSALMTLELERSRA